MDGQMMDHGRTTLYSSAPGNRGIDLNRNFKIDGVEHKNISIHTFDHAGNIASLNLDGSAYTEKEEKPQDLGANIKPIFRVTNYKDFEGRHIEGSENLNMFPIEIKKKFMLMMEKIGIK